MHLPRYQNVEHATFNVWPWIISEGLERKSKLYKIHNCLGNTFLMQYTVFIKSVQRQSSQEDLNPLFFAQRTFSCFQLLTAHYSELMTIVKHHTIKYPCKKVI